MKKIILYLFLFSSFIYGQSSWSPPSTTIQSGGNSIDLLASDYGVTADGVTDDTDSLQAAINAVGLLGGNLILPQGIILISSTIVCDSPNVRIIGQGSGGSHWNGSSGAATTLKWNGSQDGTMLEVTAVNSGTHALTNNGIINVAFDGNSALGGKGLRVVSARGGIYENLYFANLNVGALELNVVSTLSDPTDTQMNKFLNIYIRQYDQSGYGIYFHGDAGGNASFNSFENIVVGYYNGKGIVFGNSDNNTMYNVQMFRQSGGTGIGIEFQGGATEPLSARYNYINMFSPHEGGITARGTTSYTYPSRNNFIDGYDIGNAAYAVTIETNATLFSGGMYNQKASLAGNHTINLTGTATAMQALIDMMPKNLNSYSLIFQYPDGTYNLDAILSFADFYNGMLYIQGNTGNDALSTTKAVYLNFNNSTIGLNVARNACRVYVRYLKIEIADAALISCILVDDCASNVRAYSNYLIGNSIVSGHGYGVWSRGDSFVHTWNTYIETLNVGLFAQNGGKIIDSLNDAVGGSLPAYGLYASNGGTIIKIDANIIEGSVGNTGSDTGGEIR